MSLSKLRVIFSGDLIILFCLVFLGIRLMSSSCLDSFHNFAYLEAEDHNFRMSPRFPWRVEAAIPGVDESTYKNVDVWAALARTKNGKQQIWLQEGSFFFVYNVETQNWEKISARILKTNHRVSDLFLTSDGTIWGGISTWSPIPLPHLGPVLSKFNEDTKQFEAAIGGLDIQISKKQDIVLDGQDVFWLFIKSDGIYRYHPEKQTTERQTDLREIDGVSTALSLDGDIYFQDIYPREQSDFLFRFIPKTKEIVPIDVSIEPWAYTGSYSGGMLVDQKGRLWLGTVGYMDMDGDWHITHPDIENYLKTIGNPFWFPPTLIFQSSNGLLWYTEYQDMGMTGNGTAWYNPDTGKGCQFTNLTTYNLIEDAKNQIWAVFDGKLYRYPSG